MTLKRIMAALAVMAAIAFGPMISVQAVRYVYDDLDRLSEVHPDDNSNTWVKYNYDEAGNLTGKTVNNENYNITATVQTGAATGTISPSTATVPYGGSSPTFTITPASGYNLTQVLVDGKDKGKNPKSFRN